jgi:hypothetical protein
MKRLVLFVEGQSEAEAAPKLISGILTELNAWDAVILDPNPFRVRHVNSLVKDGHREWRRKLQAALTRPNVGAVLLLLDGDIKRVEGSAFCAASVGRSLAATAADVGGGAIFSVACVFARQESESWLIAGIESLAGKTLCDGRTIPETIVGPGTDLEDSPRDAKDWLNGVIPGGYKPTRDQAELTRLLDLRLVRDADMRSFRRLESAVKELVNAIRTGDHVATPVP